MTDAPRAPRVGLTKKQLATEFGASLVQRLRAITSDGQLTTGEVRELSEWLNERRDDVQGLPGAAYLYELVSDVMADGVVTADERREFIRAVERVLPTEDRAAAKAARREAEKPPATERQLAYMEVLGIVWDVHNPPDKWTASDMISAALEAGRLKPSNRQMMVLRFWDQVKVADGGRQAVSDWMDDLYAKQPECRAAWEDWKIDSGDVGDQCDPSVVPLGLGHQYLDRRRTARMRPKAPPDHMGTIVVGVVLLVVAVLLLVSR